MIYDFQIILEVLNSYFKDLNFSINLESDSFVSEKQDFEIIETGFYEFMVLEHTLDYRTGAVDTRTLAEGLSLADVINTIKEMR